MPFSLLFQLLIIAASIGGVGIAGYVYVKKRRQQTLVCPLHANCETVIQSEYSRFLGIPVELIGIGYYSFMALVYTVFLVMSLSNTSLFPLTNYVFPLSAAAFLFSLYLTFIQVASLRQYCSWCLFSAAISTVIFLASLPLLQLSNLLPFLAEYRLPLLMAHFLGVSIGIGGAVITDVFFFKFLKDFRISHEEADILNTLSQVIWFALGLIIISGLGLYLPLAEEYNQSAKFLVKMAVVAIITVNGALLNLLIAPKMIHISFGEPHQHHSGELVRLRRLAFALGSISFTSWFTAFVLGLMPASLFNEKQLLSVYGLLLLSAIVGSQLVERHFHRRAKKHHQKLPV